MNLISINCTLSYFLSADMGNILNLHDGYPLEVHKGLIDIISSPFNLNKAQNTIIGETLKYFEPGVQINTGDFYLREKQIVDSLKELYQKEKVLPSIHQKNNIQPLNSSRDFKKELISNIKKTEEIWSNNICVHLPVRKQDDTDEVIQNLTKPELLKVMKAHPSISIDLENNHHNSYFGNLYHCTHLLERLDDKLEDLGKSNLKENFNLTFDYGHFVTQAYYLKYDKREMLFDFYKNSGKRIRTIHAHNNDGIHKDQHLLLGLTPQISKEKSNMGFIGNKKVNLSKLKENEKLFFETLPELEWVKRAKKNRLGVKKIKRDGIEKERKHSTNLSQNTNFVIEIDSKYSKNGIITFIERICEKL